MMPLWARLRRKSFLPLREDRPLSSQPRSYSAIQPNNPAMSQPMPAADEGPLSVHELARLRTETHVIKKCPPRTRQGTSEKVYTGVAASQPPNVAGQVCRRNIILAEDSSDVVPQRFGPASMEDEERMLEEASEGYKLLNVLREHACPKQARPCSHKPWQGKSKRHYDFGVYYHDGDPYLTWETLQNYADKSDGINRAGKKAVADFCAWFHSFADRFILPIISNPNSFICGKFQNKLLQRIDADFPWAAERVPGLSELCQPFYSAFSSIRGFCSKAHIDKNDADPTIVINFGRPALLELTDFHCSVQLQPLDVVILSASKVKYRFKEHGTGALEGSQAAERWYVNCSFLRALESRKEPDDDLFAHLRGAKRDRQQRMHEEEAARRERTKRGRNAMPKVEEDVDTISANQAAASSSSRRMGGRVSGRIKREEIDDSCLFA